MRTVGTLVLFFLLAVVPAGAQPPSPACQRVVARAGAKLAKASLKAYQRCALKTMRGAVTAANCNPSRGGPTGDPGTDGAVAAALRRLSATIGAACAGSDLSAYGARCGAPGGIPFTFSSLILCLKSSHLDRASAMAAVEFPQNGGRAEAVGGCGTGQTCDCHCSASPSGAFVGTGTASAF